ncbi:PREDICTED: uncharacterized protein LOC108749200 [Trachymyrmex septentrionalis]|uniref:uncharacterized protein LOC108749200 n=1 Tax=Trachymyrmex septentrionalis TaxID=34720 RepID=UPI00084EE344|nr:PREDICTED: uncharacterized protein LOC108749200 [Trachymyrmex septentrionalis]
MVVRAISPHLNEWIESDHGALSYRIMQVLSGYGCFGELCRIGKKLTMKCHHCGAELDSTSHPVEHCPAWADERVALVWSIGEDLSPPTMVAAMLRGDQCRIVSSFCEAAMLQKEKAERIRKRTRPEERRGRRAEKLRRCSGRSRPGGRR